MKASVQVRPEESEYDPFYATYVDAVPEGDIVSILDGSIDETTALLATCARDHEEHRYAPGKWSIRELVGHLADAERLYAYRAVHFARGAGTPLPGNGCRRLGQALERRGADAGISYRRVAIRSDRNHDPFLGARCRDVERYRGGERPNLQRSFIGFHHCGARDPSPKGACGAVPREAVGSATMSDRKVGYRDVSDEKCERSKVRNSLGVRCPRSRVVHGSTQQRR